MQTANSVQNDHTREDLQCSADIVESQAVFHGSQQRQNAQKVQELLKSLGDANGMRMLLRLEIETIERLHGVLSTLGQKALTELRQYAIDLDDHMSRFLALGEDLIQRGRTSDKHYLLLKLQWYASLMVNDCRHHVDTPRSLRDKYAVLLEARLRHREYEARRGRGCSSEAEFICGEIVNPILGQANLMSDDDLRQSLDNASTDLQELVGRIWKTQSLGEMLSIFQCFSKVQLAYGMRHTHIALEFWRLSPYDRLHKDLLQRTFLHLLAYAGDLQSLKAAAAIDSACFLNAGIDALGLSLLAIAALRNRVDIFEFLLGLGLSSILLNSEWGNVLALAARIGSEKVVDMILQRNLFAPPIMLSLTNAIKSGHEQIAWKLLPSVRNMYQQGDQEMLSASALASARGFDSLAEALALSTPSFASTTTIHEALDNLNVNSGQYVFPGTNPCQDALALSSEPYTPGVASSLWLDSQMMVDGFVTGAGIDGVPISHPDNAFGSDASIGQDFVLSNNLEQIDLPFAMHRV